MKLECSGGSGREIRERRTKKKREGYVCGGEKKKKRKKKREEYVCGGEKKRGKKAKIK